MVLGPAHRRLVGPVLWAVATAAAVALVAVAIHMAANSVTAPATAERPRDTNGRSSTSPDAVEGSSLAAAGLDGGHGAGAFADPASPSTGDPGRSGIAGLSRTSRSSTSGGGTVAAAGAPPDSATAQSAPGLTPAPTDPPPPTGDRTRTRSSTTTTTAPSSSTTTAPPSSTTTTTPSSTTTTSTTQPSSSATYQTQGGTAAIRCDGNNVSLDYASPNDGYRTEIGDSGPDKVDVRFDSDTHESRIEVVCYDGQPHPDIREESR